MSPRIFLWGGFWTHSWAGKQRRAAIAAQRFCDRLNARRGR